MSGARYRLVHFLADPFTGARFPIAALIDTGGRVQVAKAPEPLSGSGLARQASARATVGFILDSLSQANDFDSLPRAIGPQAVLDVPHEIPAVSAAALSWVQKAVLRPTSVVASPPAEFMRLGREAAGYRFLEQWHAAKWVGRRFRAEDYFQQFSLLLPQVSQYVRGPSSRLLLMEPIVAKRESALFRVLRHIGTTFMAWQHGFEQADRRPTDVKYVAYVVAVEEQEMVAEARNVLSKSGADVIDVSVTRERSRLLDTIRNTATLAHA